MSDLRLNFASQNYEHIQALVDGRVHVDGADIHHVELYPAFTFQRMLGKREFEMSEMALTLYLSTLGQDPPPFIAIPVFPARVFRHSAIFVPSEGRVREPRDLVGKRIGEFFFYGHDTGVWAKGILSDEYNVRHDAYSYAIGGVGRAFGKQEWLPSRPPAEIKLEYIGAERTLDDMLERAEIDALIAPALPAAMLAGKGTVRRLFENYGEIERSWYLKTQIFPIMHTVVVRREIYEQNRWIAMALYHGFTKAKDAALDRYYTGNFNGHASFAMPWLTRHVEDVHSLMGRDWWPYGIEANRKALETFARYHFEQGLSTRHYRVEDLFAPETLNS